MSTHRTNQSWKFVALLISYALVTLTACEGIMSLGANENPNAESSESADDPTAGDVGEEGMAEAPAEDVPIAETAGVRRLTHFEYDNTIAALLGDDARPASQLSEPTESVFGNDADAQTATGLLIESAEVLALQVAESAMADPERRVDIVGCKPSGPDDAGCLEQFIRDFGRRALKRPVTDEEVAELMAFQDVAIDQGDFWIAAKMVLRVFLQHAEFLYRVEDGRPVAGDAGTFRLEGYEVASKMAYLLWGSTPDQALLDAAEAGELETPKGRRAQAERMLREDPDGREKAIRRIQQFHALWLGYEKAVLPEDIAASAREETDALIEKVVFEEDASWTKVFSYDETYVDPELAEHYDLPFPEDVEEAAWVKYPDERRAGIISHATFLNSGTKLGRTSPTIRGLFILERLMCGEMAPPPPDVNADDVPIGRCGSDGYCASPKAARGMRCETDADCPLELACASEHSEHYLSQDACAGCHAQMDPIGLGMENFDAYGRYRGFEPLDPELAEGIEAQGWPTPNCPIDGEGSVYVPGADRQAEFVGFRGPAELSEILVERDVLQNCMPRYFLQFANGTDAFPSHKDPNVERFLEYFDVAEYGLVDTLIHYVSDESFVYRHTPRQE